MERSSIRFGRVGRESWPSTAQVASRYDGQRRIFRRLRAGGMGYLRDRPLIGETVVRRAIDNPQTRS